MQLNNKEIEALKELIQILTNLNFSLNIEKTIINLNKKYFSTKKERTDFIDKIRKLITY